MHEDTYKLIASRIVEAMEKRHLSYGELASLTDIPKSTLQRYATGDTRKIPLDRIEAIARETNTSTAYLMGWDENEKSPEPEGAEDEVSVDEMREVLVALGYIRPDRELSESDVNFILGIGKLLNTWFCR